MGSKLDWGHKVKVWQLHYLKKTPIDRIRRDFDTGRDGMAPSWDTLQRVVKDFPSLSQAQVRQLPNVLQERWRELQSEAGREASRETRVEQKPREQISHEQQAQGREEVLIQKWRLEVASYSSVQLLQGRLDEAVNDAVRRFYTNKDTKMLYLEARRPHETLDVKRIPLQVESDPLFGLLQQKFPTSKVWTALEAWGEQAIPYLRAFRHLLDDIEGTVHRVFDMAQADNGTFQAFIVRCMLERSYAVLLACDFLARGLAALPSNIRWALLGIHLEKLRLRVNLELSSLIGHPRKGGWLDGIKDIYVEQTSAFLNELVKLQAAEDSLTAALQELESRI